MKIVLISGPTASGKSSLGAKLAQKYNGVVINADSMQIYRQIPIITAQPVAELILAPHLLYGVCDVREIFSVGKYIKLAKATISQVISQGKIPMLVGGTGLYLKSLIYGMADITDIDENLRQEVRSLYQEIGAIAFYQRLVQKDPLAAKVLNINDKQRVIRAYEVFLQTGKSQVSWWKENALSSCYNCLQIGLIPERNQLYTHINQRFLAMIEHNVLKEVAQFNALTMDECLPARKAHGVPELSCYLQGEISLDEAISKAQQVTRNYAKRQITWLRHQMPQMIKFQYQEIAEISNSCDELVAKFLND
jgi:tRNA dimethylallyltransferase